MVSTVLLSLIFLMRILPVPFRIDSLKVATRLALKATSVASSSGESRVMVGLVVSLETTVKFHVLVSLIPA